MSKKSSYFNILLSFVFLLSAILPQSSLSYSNPADAQEHRLSEEENVASFKKIRCPDCGMEFFYVPGKEGPHSRWVQYEVLDIEEENEDKTGSSFEGEQSKTKPRSTAKNKKSKKDKAVEEALSSKELEPEYELRQQLACPYDGHTFFPEGDLIDQAKFKPRAFFHEEPSSIETSFTKSVSFSSSYDLKQFGYDLFLTSEKSGKEDKDKKKQAMEESRESLSARSILKSTFGSQGSEGSGPVFSSQGFAEDMAVVSVSSDYVIGPGDMLIINIWGSVQESFPAEVDREGKIMLPKSGPLYVWGMKLKEAEERITQKLNEYYTNFNVDVSMGKLRNIRVFVMGEVKRPGAYSINSQSNIFQALYAAGGPTKLGSMRKIKIVTPDSKSKEVDLYQFLLKGEPGDGSVVQSGDTVFVPPIGDIVAIAGNVKRPGIYETKSEIPLSDLMDFAGGITPTGNLQRLQVERIKDNERRIIVDMELKSGNFKDINLRNGDMAIVSPIVRLKHNFVSILGNVENQGDYGLKEDMNVKDLIGMAKGLMPGTYLHRAEIARVTKDRSREIIPVNLDEMIMGGNDENISLKEWDILLVYSEAEASSPSFVEIDGAVNKPGRYELTPNMKISDLIFRAGSVTANDFIRGAELFHIVPGEQPVVREIGIKRMAGSIVAVDKDIILQAGDALFVKKEPKLTEKKMVAVKGEIRFPGTYPIMEGERLSDLIQRAGGYANNAFLPGTLFTRKSIKDVQEKMRQEFIKRENKAMLEEQQAILLRGSTSGIMAMQADPLKTRTEMLEFIAHISIEGRMVITLLPLKDMKHTKYDILLEDGDSLTIPQFPSAITVIGSVNNPTSVPFEAGKGIDYYIQKTGGLTKHADRSGIYVIRANGEAVNKFMMAKFVECGDTVVIPQEFRYWTPPGQLLKDTVEILSRIAVGVGIIAALN